MTLKLDDDRLRQAHGVPVSAAYFAYTGALPRNVKPADHGTARAVVLKLESAHIQAHPLTGSEFSRLKRLIAKWRRRAEGKDPRFEVMGTRPGAPDGRQRDRMLRLGWSSKHVEGKARARGAESFKCEECKSSAPRNRKDQKFCSSRCRSRAYARRQAAIRAYALMPFTPTTTAEEVQ